MGHAARDLRRVHVVRRLHDLGAASRATTTAYGNYLSPFYSPELFGNSPHAGFGPWRWPWLPFVKYSPAMLILVFPLAFRMTCYYYRGAYYKAFWADPPACTVGEPRNDYRGEAKWPLLIQNVHRYALYFALLFIVLPVDRRGEGLHLQRPRDRATRRFGDRRRLAHLLRQRRLHRRLHARLPLAAPPGGRRHRHDVARAAAQEGLRLRELPQPASPEVGLVQPVLRGAHRHLHPPLRDAASSTTWRIF